MSNKTVNAGGAGRLPLNIIKILDVLLMTGTFAFIWYRYYTGKIMVPYYRRGHWLVIFLFFVLFVLCGRTYDAFVISYYKISEMIESQILAAVVTDFCMYILVWLLSLYVPDIKPFLLMFATQIAIAVLWSVSSHKAYFRLYPPVKTFIVWDMREGMDDLINEYSLSQKFSVLGDCHVNDCVDNLSVLDGYEAVFISGVHSKDRNTIIKYCVANGIAAFIIPRIGDIMMSGAKRMHLFHLPILKLSKYDPSPYYLMLKRFFDIVISLLMLIVLSPLLLVTAICVKCTDGGPIFYKQERLTKDGRVFKIIKFRSMIVNAESDGIARLSTGENDERVTRIGRFIRKTRIDELPQLINILKGDMALVGPRPERPEIAAQYEEDLPEFRLRLQAKCGLTGYAQVYGKYNSTPYDKLQMDLMYIANPSIREDISIIFATLKILFMKESTEGISEGSTVATNLPSDTKKDE